jgi:hypothetical protein
MRCEKCGQELDAFALDCPRCTRAPLEPPPAETPPMAPQPAPLAAPPAAPVYPTYTRPPTNGLAVASLVLGLCGLVTCGATCLVGLPLGIAGLVQINRDPAASEGRGLAIAGLVISGVLLLISALLWAIIGIGAGEFFD